MNVFEKSRETRRRILEALPVVPEPESRQAGSGSSMPRAYKATADEADGQVTVKRCDSDGVVTGTEETWEVLP